MKTTKILYLLALTFSPSIFCMGYNLGIQMGYTIDINTYSYRNDGSVKAFDKANVNVTTLTGSGSITSANANVRCDAYQYNGSITCTNECNVHAKSFEGKGSISGKKVIIACDTFNFTGTIVCNGDCTIYVKQAFNYKMFKRKGSGKFTVVVSKNEFKSFTPSSLSAYLKTNLIDNCLTLTEKDMAHTLKQARSYAALNQLDDVKVIKQFKEQVQQQMRYCKERLDNQYGESHELHQGAALAGAGALGAAGSIFAFLHDKYLAERFSIQNPYAVKGVSAGLFGVSLLSLFISYKPLSNWLNPRYEEKYEQLSIVLSKIESSLQTKRVAEEEIIVLS